VFDCTCNTQNSLLLNQHNGDDAPQEGRYLQLGTLKVLLNAKAVCRTGLDKAEGMVGLLCCLKRDEVWFVNILSANKIAILFSVDILHYVC